MSWHTLIDAASLRNFSGPLVLLDASFDLGDTSAGERAFEQNHLPGALYAHLERDLSGAKTGHNGRHPLPTREAFAATAGRWGVQPGMQVVAYDQQGAPYAARLWWMLRWLGHDAVAVLDGGLAAWLAAGGALSSGAAGAADSAGTNDNTRPPYPAVAAAMPTVDAATLLAPHTLQVLDARAAERYRGETEPLDAVAGHIPGALNHFFKNNLGPDGRFKPAAELRAAFNAIGGAGSAGHAPASVVHQCGSGVTACHNLLAMEAAGLAGSRLYPGSWSEWCSDPARPVARG